MWPHKRWVCCHICQFQHMWPPACAPGIFFFLSLMHSICLELPISAHVACARVCWELYVLRASHALVQATVGVGTVKTVYIGVAYTRGGGRCPFRTCFPTQGQPGGGDSAPHGSSYGFFAPAARGRARSDSDGPSPGYVRSMPPRAPHAPSHTEAYPPPPLRKHGLV